MYPIIDPYLRHITEFCYLCRLQAIHFEDCSLDEAGTFSSEFKILAQEEPSKEESKTGKPIPEYAELIMFKAFDAEGKCIGKTEAANENILRKVEQAENNPDDVRYIIRIDLNFEKDSDNNVHTVTWFTIRDPGHERLH